VLFFQADVKGLNIGAPVTLKGVQIGSVLRVKLLFDRELLRFRTAVYIEILPESITETTTGEGAQVVEMPKGGTQEMVDTFVQRGLRGVLQMQSLITGKLQVALEFRPGSPIYLEGLEKKYPEIPTVPSKMQELAKMIENLKLDELIDKATHAVSSIDELVSSPEVKEAVSNLNLALVDARKLLQNLDGEVKPLSTSAQATLKDARKLLSNADGQLARLGDSLDETLGAAKDTFVTLNEEVIGDRAALRYELLSTLTELRDAGRAIRQLTETLNQQPDALIRGKRSLPEGE
jgi:paraquat-inducible protein B